MDYLVILSSGLTVLAAVAMLTCGGALRREIAIWRWRRAALRPLRWHPRLARR